MVVVVVVKDKMSLKVGGLISPESYPQKAE